MGMTRKGVVVYAVSGFSEWNAIIPAGSSRVNVTFKGGSFTGSNKVPAEYRTDDPFFQFVIEHSSYFKKGQIYILIDNRKDVVDGEVADGSATVMDAEKDTDVADEVAKTEEPELKSVEVATFEEARDYLIDKHGYTKSQIRTKGQTKEAARINGIVFVGAEDL